MNEVFTWLFLFLGVPAATFVFVLILNALFADRYNVQKRYNETMSFHYLDSILVLVPLFAFVASFVYKPAAAMLVMLSVYFTIVQMALPRRLDVFSVRLTALAVCTIMALLNWVYYLTTGDEGLIFLYGPFIGCFLFVISRALIELIAGIPPILTTKEEHIGKYIANHKRKINVYDVVYTIIIALMGTPIAVILFSWLFGLKKATG